MNHRNKTAAATLTANEKAWQCWELRKAGATFQQIADRGIYAERGAAYRAVMGIIQKTNTELGDELRTVMNARFDTALLAIWSMVQAGDLAAINTMLRIEGQRAKLYGIEAPVRTEITGADGGAIDIVTIDAIQARIADRLALAAPAIGAIGGVVELVRDDAESA